MALSCIYYFGVIRLRQRSGRQSHRLIHGAKELVVIKWLNKQGAGPALHRLISHRVVVICRNDDDARLWRNGLKLLPDLQTTYSRHPDINHRDSHRMALGLREKHERVAKQLRLQSRG